MQKKAKTEERKNLITDLWIIGLSTFLALGIGSIIKFVGFRVSDILPSAFIHYL